MYEESKQVGKVWRYNNRANAHPVGEIFEIVSVDANGITVKNSEGHTTNYGTEIENIADPVENIKSNIEQYTMYRLSLIRYGR